MCDLATNSGLIGFMQIARIPMVKKKDIFSAIFMRNNLENPNYFLNTHYEQAHIIQTNS